MRLFLTIMARVEQVLPQVTAKHPFLEDPPLFQFLFRWARLHECPQEGDELPVLLGHCTRQGTTSSFHTWQPLSRLLLQSMEVALISIIYRNRFPKV